MYHPPTRISNLHQPRKIASLVARIAQTKTHKITTHMKIKLSLLSTLIAMASSANAAILVVSNVTTGYAYSDVLYENVDDSLVDGGIVAMGYFGSNNPSGDIEVISATIADFTILATGEIGGYSESLGANYPGYVEAANTDLNYLYAGNPLIGKKLYAFVGNQSSLSLSTGVALYYVDTFFEEESLMPMTYLSQPFSPASLGLGELIIGTVDSITINNPITGSPETYTTIKLAAVPETSVPLLVSIGALGLLRRRRIEH